MNGCELQYLRSMAALVVSVLFLSALGGDPGIAAAQGNQAQVWNNDPAFQLPAFDTGSLEDVCLAWAPWGASSWGTEASSWVNSPDYTIDQAQFSADGASGYLRGRDDSGNWSFARYIQGDVWGGSNCEAIPPDPPIPWFIPPPLLTFGVDSTIRIDVKLIEDELLTPNQSWVMLALNVWLTSPEFPVGTDKTDHKPLVLDLVFYLDCNWANCGLHSFEDEYAYHYQTFVGEPPSGQWDTQVVNLDTYIQEALNYGWDSGSIAYAEDTLRLYQLEALMEFWNARGAARFRNFYLEYEPEDPTAVRMSSLAAVPAEEGQILIQWATATEIDLLGFHVYRGESAEDEPVRVNDTLIPGQRPGSTLGGEYTWADGSVAPGTVYFYWLETIDVSGTAQRYGPVSALSRYPVGAFRIALPFVAAPVDTAAGLPW